MNPKNEREIEQQEQTAEREEDRLEVEVPTNIQAGLAKEACCCRCHCCNCC